MTIVQPHNDLQQANVQISNGPTFLSAIPFDSVIVRFFSEDRELFAQEFFGEVIQLDGENIPPGSEIFVSVIKEGIPVGVLRLEANCLNEQKEYPLVHRML